MVAVQILEDPILVFEAAVRLLGHVGGSGKAAGLRPFAGGGIEGKAGAKDGGSDGS